jgi:hypothetical protein
VQWYRVDLFAIDSLGLSAEIFVDIHPKLGTIRILSDTNGVTLELDGTTITPPMDLVGVVGMTRYDYLHCCNVLIFASGHYQPRLFKYLTTRI